MKFAIKNRWTGSIVFEAEIEATEETPLRIRLGLAVRAAFKSDSDLRYADLRGADLSGADLSGADLSGADLRSADLRSADLSGADLRYADLSYAYLSYADLSYADLSGADLSGADLRSFKADLWMTLSKNRNEVVAVIAALKSGKVDGSLYEGECACLVGTIANAKGCDYREIEHNSGNPAEQWFAMIHKGDKPGDDTGGGFAAQKALEWCEEWCALNGVAV